MTLLTMIMKMSEGLGKTCAIFFLTILFSLPLGMLITLLRMSKNKVVSSVTRFVIAVLRGTPLMLQLLAVTYGPYYLFGTAVAKNKLIPVVIAFAINYAAYFAEIIEAVEKNCFQKGYTLILGNAWNNLEKQRAYLSMMAQKRVDGLLVMCSEYPEPLLAMLEEYRHIPMVVMDWGEAKADFTDAVIDNAFEGGYMAGRYLIERGHREIGVIPGPLERNTGAGRLAGFMKAMEEAMIKVPESWIVQGDFEPESGYRAMQQILSQPHRPTAVFCGGDIMAMGALCAADEMGLRVPQDVSLIGYDNVRNARYFTPALTTIHQPKDSLGETAFNMLLDRIVNKREEPQSIEVHPRLIERRSVADGPFRDYRR